MGWATAVVALLGLATLSWLHFRETPPEVPETRLDIATPATADPVSFALSPDGRQIVFVASGDGQPRLWLRPLDKSIAQPLAGTELARYPFWSPDSRSIGFFDGSSLKRLDLGGGSPRTLADAGAARGGTWSSDDVIVFSPTTSVGLFRIRASGGAPVEATKLDRQISHRFPHFLPGGREFLYFAYGTPETSGVYLGSLDGSTPTRLTAADAAGVYSPDGRLLFTRGGTLLAQRLDLARRELTGDPVTVADQVTVDGTVYAPGVSVSDRELVAYRSGSAGRRQLTWFDRSGKALGVLGAPDDNGLLSPRLSPDGRRAVVSRTIQQNTDIWVVDADRAERITFETGLDRYPIWSADGTTIVFDSTRKGVRHLYQKVLDNTDAEQLLLETAENKVAADWSPDGRYVSYVATDTYSAFDIWMLPLDGDRKPFAFLKTPFDERRAMFSPNGRWVAYHSNESGQFEIYVRPFPGPGGQRQVSAGGGMYAHWAPDKRELYYLAPDGTLMAAPVAIDGPVFEFRRPAPLFRTRVYGGGADANVGLNYSVSRDGRFLINTVLDDAVVTPITLIQNWKPPANGR